MDIEFDVKGYKQYSLIRIELHIGYPFPLLLLPCTMNCLFVGGVRYLHCPSQTTNPY